MLLVVCGCSWSCRDPQHPNIEFGQKVADHFNYEYLNIAKPGCSNFGIALQVEYAIQELNADVVIINATTPTRGEFKLKDSKRYNPRKHYHNVDYDHKLIEKFTDKHAPGYGDKYDPTILIDSFGSILNEDLNSELDDLYLLPRYSKVFDKSSYDAFKKWFLYLFDADIERHKQQMILQNSLYKLQLKGKKYLFSPNTFDWAESFDLKNPNVYSEENTSWDIPRINLQRKGIADYLEVCDEIWGSWENSKGPDYDHHLPEEAHTRYADTVIKQLSEVILSE